MVTPGEGGHLAASPPVGGKPSGAHPRPPWLQEFLDGVDRAMRLDDDWDSYGALPLLKQPAVAGFDLLSTLGFGGPAPHVSPTGEGGLHLEWAGGSFGLKLEITPAGRVIAVTDDDGVLQEWTPGPGDEALRAALRRVAARSR